jgi:hypothetical protein
MRRAVSRILPSRLSRHNTTHGSRGSGSAGPDPEAKTSSTFAPIAHSNFKIDLSLIADFYIAIDEPHKLWLPGDEISGQIILILRKNLANIAITLALNGYIKINASSHLKLRPVKHVLFNHTIKIYGEEDSSSGADNDIDHDPDQFQNGLYKGEHRFPFIVKLPNKRVYTSINFGKGSIAYLLKATIGNMQPTAPSTANSPTAASPTISASTQQLNNDSPNNATSSPGDANSSSLRIIAKAKLLRMLTNSTQTLEKLINIISPIDVAKLSPPKPKRLTLKDPRNSSRKLSRTQSSTSTINTFTTLSSNNSDTTETNRIGDQHREEEIITQLDDAPNVNLSAAIGTNMLHPVTPSSDNSAAAPKPSVTSTSNSLRQRPDAVRVSLEISDLGYLRGELIPIKLNISHLKKIQDSNGIIITFLRVCRLENGPDGLFDSFRKDLYQLIIPLYVDPCTLKSEINTSVRVPADAFPTISGCPLVSFQYFIEVLINLSGKSIQFDGGDTNTSASNAKDLIIGAASNTAQVGSTFSFDFLQPQGSFNSKERLTYINTDKYKRMKKFLQLTSEVIVGTHRLKAVVLRRSNEDSELYSQTSRRSLMLSGPQMTHSLPHLLQQCSQSTISPSFSTEHVDGMERTSSPGVTSFATPPYSRNNGPAPDYDDSSPSASENLVPLPHQSAMSEKEQMIVREASLMPSAPPLDDIEEDGGGVSPVDHNEDIMQHIQGQGGPSQGLLQPSTAEPQDGLFFINADRDIDVTPDGVMIPQPIFTSNDESNNLYSDIDFVPKYELSGNDVAIEQAGSPNVSETATYQAPRQERGDY